MNHLAHCLIAALAAPTPNSEPDLIAGGLLGDRIKGRVPDDWPPVLRLGVALHRRLDAFSNVHPQIRTSCERFPAELRRIAPVFVDVLADHVLSLEWGSWADEDLDAFERGCCALARRHVDRLDPAGRHWLAGIEDYRLLARYGSLEVVTRAFAAITRRLGRSHLDELVTAALPDVLPGCRADFAGYFPDLVEHARHFVARPFAV